MNPLEKRGNCYAASEALYHILGGKRAGWKPMRFPLLGPDRKLDTHWFLKHESGLILDPSRLQFSPRIRSREYKQAVGSGFLTKKPSRKAKRIIKELTWQTR